jgi:hypothetical protein
MPIKSTGIPLLCACAADAHFEARTGVLLHIDRLPVSRRRLRIHFVDEIRLAFVLLTQKKADYTIVIFKWNRLKD